MTLLDKARGTFGRHLLVYIRDIIK